MPVSYFYWEVQRANMSHQDSICCTHSFPFASEIGNPKETQQSETVVNCDTSTKYHAWIETTVGDLWGPECHPRGLFSVTSGPSEVIWTTCCRSEQEHSDLVLTVKRLQGVFLSWGYWTRFSCLRDMRHLWLCSYPVLRSPFRTWCQLNLNGSNFRGSSQWPPCAQSYPL